MRDPSSNTFFQCWSLRAQVSQWALTEDSTYICIISYILCTTSWAIWELITAIRKTQNNDARTNGKTFSECLPSLRNVFSRPQSKKSDYMIAGEQGERECLETKGKWPFVSMSSTEQVENPKYPLKRKGKRCVVCLLYCLNIFMLMNPRWQAVQIIHEWIDCLWPFNTREASALLSRKLTINCNLQRPINTLAKFKIRRHFT